MNITEISIKRPSLVVVIFAILGFLGVICYMQLNYELLPKYSEPVLVVSTVYPGASPSEVENSVTKKIEDAVSSLEETDNIQSTSYEGISVSVIIFKSNADMDKALRDAQRKVANIQYLLPKDSRPPIVTNFSIDDIPIMRLGITAKMGTTELYDLVKYKIQPMFSTIEGVAQVDLIGGEEREIRINVDRDKLNAFGLSILQVTLAIQSSNMEFPTGKIKDSASSISSAWPANSTPWTTCPTLSSGQDPAAVPSNSPTSLRSTTPRRRSQASTASTASIRWVFRFISSLTETKWRSANWSGRR